MRRILGVGLILWWMGACSSADTSVTPVYVTIAGHIEDVAAYANCNTYPSYREKLLAFAQRFAAFRLNLQIDYEFLTGATRCETDDLKASTDGRNVVDYLVEHYRYEIDAHQEGGWEEGGDNYADVRLAGGEVTAAISETVGGFMWDDLEQLPRLMAGETGLRHPDFTWRPEVLTLAVGVHHHEGDFSEDDLTSGVWIPAGPGASFKIHDANGRMVNVGPGQQHSNWGASADCRFQDGADYVLVLIDYLRRGILPPGRVYTATITVPQKVIFNQSNQSKLETILDKLIPVIANGRAVYASYSEVVALWQGDYQAQPNILSFDAIDPVDYTCPQ